jgi:3-phenylpropionate/trans-cinnamate dioxygenase ferredoxin reductase subunit
MLEQSRKYVIIGGGLAGASAVAGIREIDSAGSIAVIGDEKYRPYNRPPLSKKLWFGKQTVDEIFVHKADYYAGNGVDLVLDTEAVAVDALGRVVQTSAGDVCRYEKLVIATGGKARHLVIPGAVLDGVCYYRYLDDYHATKALASKGKSAVVIGGGFIGSEMAAALSVNGVDVTMVFPDPYICKRVFPEALARSVEAEFTKRGVRIVAGDAPETIEKDGSGFVTRTQGGLEVRSDIVLVGIGIVPSTSLAEGAGLTTQNGIVVNEYLQTSNPDIYAAGDNACFPYQALDKITRVEHWDNALNQGTQAGKNMAGAAEAYVYMPYFFSDLFDFGYEAVGDVDSRLETVADWQKDNDTGVVYYMQDGRVRGAMMCNVWDKVPAARELIQSGRQMSVDDLRGAIG